MRAVVAVLMVLVVLLVGGASASTARAAGSFLDGVPGPGVEFAVYSGGPAEELPAAAPNAASFFTTVDGAFVGYVAGAPGFVNAGFLEHFAAGIPANTPLIVYTPAAPAPEPPSTVLGVGESIDLGGGERLTFTGVVQDSRCPVDVQCVWAGEAVLAFALTGGGTTVERSIGFSPGGEASGVLGSYRVTVLAVAPEPKSTVPIPSDGYEVTVSVDGLVTTPGGSGLEGVVTLGPLCPVQQLGAPCPDRVYAATLVLLDANEVEVGRVTSGADGWYRLAADPGVYTLAPQSPDGSPLPFAGPIEVTVVDGVYAVVDVAYDSGIR